MSDSKKLTVNAKIVYDALMDLHVTLSKMGIMFPVKMILDATPVTDPAIFEFYRRVKGLDDNLKALAAKYEEFTKTTRKPS